MMALMGACCLVHLPRTYNKKLTTTELFNRALTLWSLRGIEPLTSALLRLELLILGNRNY